MAQLSGELDLGERGLVRIYAGPREVEAAAAAAFAAVVAEAVAARGRAAVALAGGGTPRGLYRLLGEPPWRDRLPWPRLHFFWGDERAVPPDHPESNFRMAREALFDHVPVPEESLHRIRGEWPAEEAAAAYEAEMKGFFAGGPPAFDVVWLGLGNDGHTASLFPGDKALDEPRRLAAAASGPEPRRARVTLTLPVLNRARHAFFLVLGNDKAAVLAELLSETSVRPLPARRVRPESGELVFWVDGAAASDLGARRAFFGG